MKLYPVCITVSFHFKTQASCAACCCLYKLNCGYTFQRSNLDIWYVGIFACLVGLKIADGGLVVCVVIELIVCTSRINSGLVQFKH